MEKETATLKNLFTSVMQLFGIVAGSLSGITAVFTSVGFLAERSHLKMLGFTTIPVDMHECTYSGGMFFVLLPSLIIFAIGLNVLSLVRLYPGWIGGFLVAFLLWWAVQRFGMVERVNKAVTGKFNRLLQGVKDFIYRHRSGFLILLMIVQLLAIFQMNVVNQVGNLVFERNQAYPAASAEPPGMLFPNAEDLKYWILHHEDIFQSSGGNPLAEYIGWQFIVTLVLGLLLWLTVSGFRRDGLGRLSFRQQIWLTANLIFFISQLILLPVNYGALHMSNRFPEVEVTFNPAENGALSWPADAGLCLLHQDGGTFYLYSRREARVYYVRNSDIRSLVYIGRADILASP